MTMLSQYFDHTEIGEQTKLQLFDEANRQFNNSLDHYYDLDGIHINECDDPVFKQFCRDADQRHTELMFIFKILGIYDEYMMTAEIDITRALNEGITWQEAKAKRILQIA